MNEQTKYAELLKEIGRILAEKNETLILQDLMLSDVKKKLQAAEKKIKEMQRSNKNEFHSYNKR